MATARADFQVGVAAYERGDYATALREFLPFAEQGHSSAQNKWVLASGFQTGFGPFVVSKRRARKARNPRTGEAIRVKASKSVRFRPGQTLKRTL